MHHAPSRRPAASAAGFTLIELLVVISIIALLIGILLPALGSARQVARQAQNSTQIRSIHQAMVAAAQENNNMLPGVDSPADYIAGNFQENTKGNLTMASAKYLIKNGFIDSSFFLSPADTEDTQKFLYTDDPAADVKDPGDTKAPANAVFYRDNHSYGMVLGSGGGLGNDFPFNTVRWEMSAGTANPLPANVAYTSAADELAPIFAAAWTDNFDSTMPVVSDRILFKNSAGTGYGQSLWVGPGEPWTGSIAWNDGHVAWETDEANVQWTIKGYTGKGLIPPVFNDLEGLPFDATVFMYQ